ncbi:hypothetical protein GJ496_002250 [Pomphorhynchus laevis]|nr:hypothetical protein GJ496_002250 [Pomphorhynchus laevis]
MIDVKSLVAYMGVVYRTTEYVVISSIVLCNYILQQGVYANTETYYKLFDDVLNKRGINPIIRPVTHANTTIEVFIHLKLLQILAINEKDQYMMTTILMHQEWKDELLLWDPLDYDNITMLHIPIDRIWNPEIVLFNNVDGNYDIDLLTSATVLHTGVVIWEPPAVFKSSCAMNVEFFPFDEQHCPMKFGSWIYDTNQVDIFPYHHKNISIHQRNNYLDHSVDLSELNENMAWSVMNVPGERHVGTYKFTPQKYSDMTFYITVRRRSLFFTINLIIPCVGISFLAVLTFYLPSDSGEKISLSISIMLSLSVFVLLLSELMPETSVVVPIVGKYLLFTEILVTVAIVITVAVLNVHFRSPLTNRMSNWIRLSFTRVLPRLLMLKRTEVIHDNIFYIMPNKQQPEKLRQIYKSEIDLLKHYNNVHHKKIIGDLMDTANELWVVSQELQIDEKWRKVKDDWKFVALVLDRLFLWIFTTASIIGTLGILCQAPNIYSNSKPITSINQMNPVQPSFHNH